MVHLFTVILRLHFLEHASNNIHTVKQIRVYATLISVAAECGLKFDKTTEIHGSDEVEDRMRALFLSSGDSEGAGGSLSAPSSSGSASAEMAHSKPQRPGRGKPRTITKFSVTDS